ncbi:MAG: hypothetical protein K6G89_08700 [Clostridia bacterium]|nr:hypothetical protein [Clostridia bacterium]
MKKLLFAAAVFVTLAMFTVASFAATSFDRMYVNQNVLDQAQNISSSSFVNVEPGDRIYILGWAAKDGTVLQEVYYKLDGAAKACDGSTSYAERNDVARSLSLDPYYCSRSAIGSNGAMMELLGINELEIGSYSVEIVAKYYNGDEEVIKIFELRVGPSLSTHYTLVPGNLTPGENALWLVYDGQHAVVEFTSNVSFSRIMADYTWASRMDLGRSATVVLNLYTFTFNPDFSMSMEPFASYTFQTIGDNNPSCVLDLEDKAAPAGTYIFEIKTVGTNMIGNAGAGGYLVLDGAKGTPDPSKVRYLDETSPFSFAIDGEAYDGSVLDDNPADTEEYYDYKVIPGDVDGDGEVTDWDGITLDRYLANWFIIVNYDAMDVDCDGEVTDWDAIVLGRYLAGWEITLGEE